MTAIIIITNKIPVCLVLLSLISYTFGYLDTSFLLLSSWPIITLMWLHNLSCPLLVPGVPETIMYTFHPCIHGSAQPYEREKVRSRAMKYRTGENVCSFFKNWQSLAQCLSQKSHRVKTSWAVPRSQGQPWGGVFVHPQAWAWAWAC